MKRILFTTSILSLVFVCASSVASPAPELWNPAVVITVGAAIDNSGFTIDAVVRLPQPCYDLVVKKVLIATGPPHYLVLEKYRGGMCTEVVTGQAVTQHFTQKPLPKNVNVYTLDKDGKSKHWVVPVVRLKVEE